jgi:hypothetical protein
LVRASRSTGRGCLEKPRDILTGEHGVAIVSGRMNLLT